MKHIQLFESFINENNPFEDGTFNKGEIVHSALQKLYNKELMYDEEDGEDENYPKPITSHSMHKEIEADENKVMKEIKKDKRFSDFKEKHWNSVRSLLSQMYDPEGFASEPIVQLGRELKDVDIIE